MTFNDSDNVMIIIIIIIIILLRISIGFIASELFAE